MGRVEDRFGETSALGTTYTSLGTVPASTTWNLLLHVTNRIAVAANLRAYIADNSWSTGEPSGGTLKVAIAYDVAISPGDLFQLSGIILKANEKLIVRSDQASSLDISANGVVITP